MRNSSAGRHFDQPYKQRTDDHTRKESSTSVKSSVDDDMLDKIKNIYSEMRKTTTKHINHYVRVYDWLWR